MKSKAITLFRIRNIQTGNLVRERLTPKGVEEVRRSLSTMSVDFDEFLSVEPDPSNLYETVYTPTKAHLHYLGTN